MTNQQVAFVISSHVREIRMTEFSILHTYCQYHQNYVSRNVFHTYSFNEYKSHHYANFVITAGSVGFPHDNPWCHQWQQSWHHDNPRFSMFTFKTPCFLKYYDEVLYICNTPIEIVVSLELWLTMNGIMVLAVYMHFAWTIVTCCKFHCVKWYIGSLNNINVG